MQNLLCSHFQVAGGAQGNTLKELMAGMKYPSLEHTKKGYSSVLSNLHSDKVVTVEAANGLFLQALDSHINKTTKAL